MLINWFAFVAYIAYDTFQALVYGTYLVLESEVKKLLSDLCRRKGKYHLCFMIKELKLCSVK